MERLIWAVKSVDSLSSSVSLLDCHQGAGLVSVYLIKVKSGALQSSLMQTSEASLEAFLGFVLVLHRNLLQPSPANQAEANSWSQDMDGLTHDTKSWAK